MLGEIKLYLIGILRLFNNAASIAGIISAVIISFAMLIKKKFKILAYSTLISFILAVLSMVILIVSNTPDNLFIPLYFVPVFMVMFIVLTACGVIKIILHICGRH